MASAQEQHRARREATLLPPGLLNNGNTCFMNSVLQALIATRYLQLPVTSPAFTNGHDHPWSDALPIADHLVAFLRTAWDIQNTRKREHISPKELLTVLGNKYDQYLDFRQQDAHEFLSHLLDAVRMEEMDAIKQRSPPQPKSTKRVRPDEPSSFVDMLFGGKLTSVLVCQTCKHVSHTYEDFSGLSLSMKPEDYVRERKRDKLKQFAKKIGTAFYAGQRSSSVPATPVCDSVLDNPEHTETQRRRSIDLADVEVIDIPDPIGDTTKLDAALQVPPSPAPDTPSIPATPTDPPQPLPATDILAVGSHHDSPSDHITFVAPEKVNGKEKRDKDESWARLSRRISVSVGLAMRPKPERKDKKGIKPSDEESPVQPVPATPADAVNGVALPSPPEREPTSLGLVNEKLQAQLKRSVKPAQRPGNSLSGPRFPLISRPSSPSKVFKRPRAPRLSTEETAYLRDILADINPPNIPKPFSLFKHTKESTPSTSTRNSQHIFLRVNQISRIEECLRLFTSVEVLDGDNTVRCHRCWKIANGFYKPKARQSAQDPDSCTDSEDDHSAPGTSPTHLAVPAASSSRPDSPSHSTTSLQYTQTTRDTQSTLTRASTHRSSTHKHVPPALQLNDGYPIELVSPVSHDSMTLEALAVPLISTTPPESPMSVQTAKPTTARIRSMTQATVIERTSLSAPADQHRSGDSNTESEISEAESETLLSVYSDVSSAASSNASQEQLQRPSPSPDTSSKDKSHPSGVPRAQQYLRRPAYKRYLIATPPPVLVVHLKRFQQLSKAPVVAFATGFKKLDDYIAFPELLDLAPYLAPRREDYFDSKVAVARGRSARRVPAPCMYRLYAVVVHIGSMLSGHYVAYTALPPSPPSPSSDGTNGVRSENDKTRSEQPREWAFISDTIVRLATLEEVLKSKAYICMYERI